MAAPAPTTLENVPSRTKSPNLARRAPDEKSSIWREARKNSLKFNERCGNVDENKGPLWKTWWRSGNVVENKGTYR